MIVHSFTSSSNERLPTGNWLKIWITIILGFVFFVLYFEIDIRLHGWSPSVIDDQEQWSTQRRLSSDIGKNALILVGDSRAQLGYSLDTVREMTDFIPVQLAIYSTFMPVLSNLAEDESITGTVIVAVNIKDFRETSAHELANQWVEYYETYRHKENFIEPYKLLDGHIESFIKQHFALRQLGARPFKTISKHLFEDSGSGSYLVTYHDRSRDADYSKVTMPDFYIRVLERHLGKEAGKDRQGLKGEDLLSKYKSEIENIKPESNRLFMEKLEKLLNDIDKIESRGGKVIIVRLPTDKLIWEIDKRRYPRKQFWDVLAKQHPASIHFQDYPQLTQFSLPDGSHVDVKDKKRFTRELMQIVIQILAKSRADQLQI
jgi:hypothetical protein